MITLNEIDPEALYVPGLRFWKQTAPTRHGVICQNTNGAVEIWHALRDPAVGQVLAHSPVQRGGHQLTMECSILGGRCFSKDSFAGYRVDFLPLLVAEDDRAVLKLLADWHDKVFSGTRVTA